MHEMYQHIDNCNKIILVVNNWMFCVFFCVKSLSSERETAVLIISETLND